MQLEYIELKINFLRFTIFRNTKHNQQYKRQQHVGLWYMEIMTCLEGKRNKQEDDNHCGCCKRY